MRFRPDPLARGDGLLEEHVQDGTGRAVFVGHDVGLFDLAEDLTFAEDQRVQAGSDVEQVVDAGFSRIDVEIGRFISRTAGCVEEEVAQGLFIIAHVVDDGIDFGAVARRQDDGFAQAAVIVEMLQGVVDGVGCHSEVFPDGDGDGLMIEAEDDEVHFMPRLRRFSATWQRRRRGR